MIMDIYWRQAGWLLLALYPLLAMLWQYFVQQRNRPSYADAALLPWVQVASHTGSSYVRHIMWFGFFLLLAISLAGPRFALPHPAKPHAAPYDIMVLVDVSRSMQSRDILPNRRQRASLELYEFLDSDLAQNSRIAVIVYAARPHLLVPFTQDQTAVQFYLHYLDSLILPTQGSDAEAGFKLAIEYLDKRQNRNLPTAMVWLTDGDIPTAQYHVLHTQVSRLKTMGITLSILGIGTQDGEAIPLADNTWLEYQGQIVRSRLNSPLLQKLADAAQGQYSEVQADNSDWQALMPTELLNQTSLSTSEAVIDSEDQQWQELYLWSLCPAILLLFLLVLVPRRTVGNQLNSPLFISLATGVILLMYALIPNVVYAGNLTLDKGIQAYRTQQYPAAIKLFSAAVFKASNDTERARTLHNLGNSYFQQGDYAEAMQVFKDALIYRPKYMQTQHNLVLAQTVLTALQQRLAAQAAANENENNLSGSRFESQNNSLDWNQDSTKVWGNNFANTKAQPINPLDSTALTALVQQGFQRLEEKNNIELLKDGQNWQQQQQSLYDARIALQQMESNPADLFKRLFEIEEGFYSKNSEPQTLAEVLPW